MIEKIKTKIKKKHFACFNVNDYKGLFIEIEKRTHFVKQIIKIIKKVNFPENIKSVKRLRGILDLTCNSGNTF